MVLLYCLPIILYFVCVIRFRVSMRVCFERFNFKRNICFPDGAVGLVAKTTVAVRKHYNFYLALAAIALLCGCKTDKDAKVFSALRVHIQAPRMTATSATVPVIRSNAVLVMIANEPILTESDVYGARVIDAQGGF